MKQELQMNFDSLGLSDELLRAVNAQGYSSPTLIQAQSIPAILNGADVMGAAQTGTGKTAGFTLPILHQLQNRRLDKSRHIRVLILTPTRELAAQVQESVSTYGRNLNLRSTAVFGGVKINPQIKKLRAGVDILVATPGRLLDLYEQHAVLFGDVETLVLDEADRMLDMGFIHDIKKIMRLLPEKRQNLMFSATFSNDIRKLARQITRNPVEIDVAPRNSTVDIIKQKVLPVDKARKAELLSFLIRRDNWFQVLVFNRTRRGVDKLVRRLSRDGIHATAIHSDKSQQQRMKALAGFKKNKIQVLVATDIAARGIDIDQLSHVVNFDLPNVPEDYVHRIGRTGRAGAVGEAISLVSADENKLLQGIESLIKRKIEREEVDGFEPEHNLPETKNSGKKRPGGHPNKGKKQSSRRNKNNASGARNKKPASRTGAKRPGKVANKSKKGRPGVKKAA